MKPGAWEKVRSIPAVIGLGLPLLAIGLTRFRGWVALAYLVLGIAALASRKRYPRVATGLVVFYLASCVFLILRTLEIVESASTDVWFRAGAAGLALIALFFGAQAAFENVGWIKKVREKVFGQIATELLVVAFAVVIIRLGQWGLWENPSIISGILVAFPVLHFKPRPAVLMIFAACCSIVILEWHGYMLTENIERVPKNLPKGVALDMLYHGDPQALQGARFFDKGKCPASQGAVYMGEMRRTYRLNPDGTELNLVVPDQEKTNEAVCSVVELCDEGVVITGSDEGRFVRFSDMETGEVLKDVPTKGQPTFLVLSPDWSKLYVSIINPGGIVRIDLKTRTIDREFGKYLSVHPAFSGVNNIVISDDRIYGAWSSYFTLDNRQGDVFSLDLELEDYRPLFSFYGSWGIVAPDDENHIFFKVYSRPGLYRVAKDGSGATNVINLPAGYHYLVRLQKPSVVVINHWSTGEVLSLCTNDFQRQTYLNFGGMGRPMSVDKNRIRTAVPAGYATLTYAENLCD